MKAVIPAGGRGTRLLPATKAVPKEMLPVLSKPAIQWVVEEAVAAGMREVVLVTARGKAGIEDHFDRAPDLEDTLRAAGEDRLRAQMHRLGELADVTAIRQREPLGLGHAVLLARDHVGQSPFAVLLPDDLVVSREPCIAQLARVVRGQRGRGGALAVARVPRARIPAHGIVAVGKRVGPGVHEITDLVEKPPAEEAPSDLGIIGRYVLTPGIFDALERTKPGARGELQLTDALRAQLAEEKLYAVAFEGRRLDVGTPAEWLKANLELALRDPELRAEVLPAVRALARRPPPPDPRKG